MSDDDTKDGSSSDHLREASDSLVEGASSMSQFWTHLYDWAWAWSEEHPLLTWILALPVSWYFTQGMLRVAGDLYSYAFGNNVVASTDLQVQTHPLPVGFSLNLLYVALILALSVSHNRIATLRRRIEELENEFDVEDS